MCTSPITIPNPYYGLGNKGLNYLRNTHDTHIQVPCGSCRQCITVRQHNFLQRVQMESLRSHLYFFTLTYNPEHLPRTNINDYKIPYPDKTHVQKMFKRIRKQFPYTFRYAVVSEYGTRTHRPHFHGLIAVESHVNNKYSLEYRSEAVSYETILSRLILKEWRVNVGSRKFPKYEPLLTYVNTIRQGRTYDFHYIKPVVGHDNDCSFYVSKYLMKYDDHTHKLLQKIRLDPELTHEETSTLISLIKPAIYISKSFGDARDPVIKNYIKHCLSQNEDLPQFYDIYTGKHYLLSPYYRKYCLPLSYRLNQFYKLTDKTRPDSFVAPDKYQTIQDEKRAAKSLLDRLDDEKKAKNICRLKYSD